MAGVGGGGKLCSGKITTTIKMKIFLQSERVRLAKFYSNFMFKNEFFLRDIYMRPEVNSNRFDIPSGFENSFLLIAISLWPAVKS